MIWMGCSIIGLYRVNPRSPRPRSEQTLFEVQKMELALKQAAVFSWISLGKTYLHLR